MKTTIITLALLLSFNTLSGELHWQTNSCVQSRLNCTIEAQSHSNTTNSNVVSEYWIDCKGDTVTPIHTQVNIDKSLVYLSNQATFICPMETSIFGKNDAFYILLDCSSTIYQNEVDN